MHSTVVLRLNQTYSQISGWKVTFKIQIAPLGEWGVSESCASYLPVILKFSKDGEYALKKDEKCTKPARLRVLWTMARRAGCLPFSTD